MLLLGALLCPSITKGQAYQLSKISGTRDNKEEIYTYYYSDRLLDSITTQQGGAWMLKEIPEYDASKRLVKLDEWQFSNYKKQWYLANHYDYKYNAQRQAADLTKNTQAELKLYAEQVVSSTQSTIADSLTDRIVRDNVKAMTTDADFMQKLMLAIVQQWTVGEPMVIETAHAEALEKYMLGNAKALLDSGQVTIRTGSAQGAGFSVAPADGSYKVNFGEEEFVNFFKSFLRPRLVEELF